MTNGEDYRNSLIRVFTVLSVLYVPILRVLQYTTFENIMQTILREKYFDMVSEG